MDECPNSMEILEQRVLYFCCAIAFSQVYIEYVMLQGPVVENDEQIRGFKSDFIMAIQLGGEKCCIIGIEWWCVCEEEYPFRWEL